MLIGTDTFLAGYARNADAGGFRSVRYVIAGAEALKAETRRVYLEKFGLQLFEGYGVDRSLAGDGRQQRRCSTGTARSGGSCRTIEPRASSRCRASRRAGGSSCEGPNIMVGYYRADNPGEIEPPRGRLARHRRHRGDRRRRLRGDQGPRQALRQDRRRAHLARRDRGARLRGLWPDATIAASPPPTPKRGERVVLVTTDPGATRAQVQAWLKIKGASEIMAPASIVVLDAIPLLGSGKTDYVALARMLRERGA